MNQAAIALLAVTFATFINSLGYIFYKFAHIRVENSKDKNLNYVFTWQFLCGFGLIVLGAIINIGKNQSMISELIDVYRIELNSNSKIIMHV